jgi:hypothetical protein
LRDVTHTHWLSVTFSLFIRIRDENKKVSAFAVVSWGPKVEYYTSLFFFFLFGDVPVFCYVK